MGSFTGDVEVTSDHHGYVTKSSRFFKHLRQQRVVGVIGGTAWIMGESIY
jgi:hypothetical protein